MEATRTYCKAYLARDFRQFGGWAEKLGDLRPEIRDERGQETQIPRTELTDDDILYLHDNFVVTDDRFPGENIIFDDLTDEWKSFCTDRLAFEIPAYEAIEIPV